MTLINCGTRKVYVQAIEYWFVKLECRLIFFKYSLNMIFYSIKKFYFLKLLIKYANYIIFFKINKSYF